MVKIFYFFVYHVHPKTKSVYLIFTIIGHKKIDYIFHLSVTNYHSIQKEKKKKKIQKLSIDK
jgi:hypothetical protein